MIKRKACSFAAQCMYPTMDNDDLGKEHNDHNLDNVLYQVVVLLSMFDIMAIK